MRDTLDHIGIQRPLREEGGSADFSLCVFEYIDKGFADDLALLFRITDALEALKEERTCILMHQRDIEMITEQADDFFRFVLAHQAGVDKDAGELVADRGMQQARHDGGINAAGDAANNPFTANLFADFLDSFILIGIHRPVIAAAGDLNNEVFEDLVTFRCMHNFGVELHAIEFALFIRNGGIGAAFISGDDLEACGHLLDAVTVAHPHLRIDAAFPDAAQER